MRKSIRSRCQVASTVSSSIRSRPVSVHQLHQQGGKHCAFGAVQEVGSFAPNPQPTTATRNPPTCSPNLGGSIADPVYNNPSYSIFNTTTYSQSPSLTLALLLEAWPVNSYPYVVQLPTGSVFVAAGILNFTCYILHCTCPQFCFSPHVVTKDSIVP